MTDQKPKKTDRILTKMDERWITVLIFILRIFVIIYNFVTLPLFFLIDKPWITQKASERVRAKSVTGKPEGPYVHVDSLSPLQLTIMSSINTLYELFRQLVVQHQKKVCLGTRQVIDEEDELQSNGKVFKKVTNGINSIPNHLALNGAPPPITAKFVLGNYHWDTFEKVHQRIRNFSWGLESIGQTTGENVVLFAETRAEWLIAALACFRNNIPIVTLYANLGDEALIHGINQTEVKLVITSRELLPKFKSLLSHTPKVERIIYMEDYKSIALDGFPENVQISTFNSIEKIGKDSIKKPEAVKATKEDVAIIMYTSGSTGIPKGVIISHGNLLAALEGFSNLKADIREDDIYLAYLPLAHVLELSAEFLCLLYGVPIGYSSPLTISDQSSKVKKGCKGDATILRPTIMASVPLILDRIYKNATELLSQQHILVREIFHFAYDYKIFWMKRGFSTPIVDNLIFQQIKNLLGGRLRIMVTGGAPLSSDTHDFIRICFNLPLLQGFGLTETCACATVMDFNDFSTGRVGCPMSCCQIELADWDEGNYRVTDKPFPRGEIIVGGSNVCPGYYKLEDKTNEDFFEKNGQRWFRTGDIGEMHPDGCLKIIDRKKDLVKLQFGEYVSLGKVEGELKLLNIVENVCVYGDSTKTFTVALISPNAKQLALLAHDLGKNGLSINEMCIDSDIQHVVEKMVQEQGKKGKVRDYQQYCNKSYVNMSGGEPSASDDPGSLSHDDVNGWGSSVVKAHLQKFEVPLRVRLVNDTWLPDSGLVTAAYKLKRKAIQEKYQDLIDIMYES